MAWPYDVPIPRQPFRFPNDVMSRDPMGRPTAFAGPPRSGTVQNMLAGMDSPNPGSRNPSAPPNMQDILSGQDPLFGDRETGGSPHETAPTGFAVAGEWMRENMPETYGLFTGAPRPSVAEPVKGDRPQPTDPTLPGHAPVPTARPENTPEVVEPATPTLSPNEQIAQDIAEKRALLDSVFPQRDTSVTPEQQRATDFAQKELNRTNLLAQLAFASGLTAAGGGSWKQIGLGLAAAGKSYDEGFERYSKALQTAADQIAKTRDVQYGDELARSEAAFKLYADESKQARETAAEQEKQRYTKGADFFKTTKPGDFATPEEQEKFRRNYQFFLRTGIFLNDTADE